MWARGECVRERERERERATDRGGRGRGRAVMIYKCPCFDERVKDGDSRRKEPSINPTVSKSPLILFDRSRACNLIVRITNDPFVPQRGDGGDTSVGRYTPTLYNGVVSPKVFYTHTHNIIDEIIQADLKNVKKLHITDFKPFSCSTKENMSRFKYPVDR